MRIRNIAITILVLLVLIWAGGMLLGMVASLLGLLIRLAVLVLIIALIAHWATALRR